MACVTALAVLQGLVVAPFVDVARDHDPLSFAACPSATHLEPPIETHRGLGCLFQLAATLIGTPLIAGLTVPAAPTIQRLEANRTSTRIAGLDARRLPPARAPPTHG